MPKRGRKVARKAPSGRELAPKAPEGARATVEALQGREIHTVVAPKFGGWYPKQNLTSKLRALPLPPDGATPLPEGGLHPPPVDKIKFFTNYVRTNPRLPCVKGAGARAPEGL